MTNRNDQSPKRPKTLTAVTVAIMVAWCLLVLSSWLLSAMMVDGVRSLLTGEGLRWLFGNMAYGLLSPLLVWLLMAAMAWGCLRGCRVFAPNGNSSCRRKSVAFRVATLLTLVYVAVIALLTFLPHAVLLSPTGTLWHSPFSRALLPLVFLGAMLFGVVYGLVARTFTSLHDIIEAMVNGLRSAAPLLLAYMLLMPLALALRYVFC